MGQMELSRRRVLEMLAAMIAGSSLGLPGKQVLAQERWCNLAPTTYDPQPSFAVSLRALSEGLVRCTRNGRVQVPDDPSCQALLTFQGLTRLDGFVLDPANNDIVVWGQKEVEGTPVHIDDFVVALRSSFYRYPRIENGREVHYAPAISLDAVEPYWREYNSMVGNGAAATYGDYDFTTEEGFEAVRARCNALPMYVRVDGMARRSRLAKVLVDADYRMKLIADSGLTLNVPDPFPSPFESASEARHFMQSRGREMPHYPTSHGRFWFTPGEFRVETDWSNGVGYFKTSQILLKDSLRAYSDDASLSNSEPEDIDDVNPFWRAFTCAWSERMDEVVASEWIWQEMFHGFRHMGLARFFKDNDVYGRSNFDLDYLLDRHVIYESPIPEYIFFQPTRLMLDGGEYTSVKCGGVSVGFDDETLLEERAPGQRHEVAHQVMGGTNAQAGSVSWQVT